MTITPPIAPAAPLRNASLDLARSVLMGVGTPLLVKGLVTSDQWQAIVGGVLALASALWSYLAAHPGQQGFLATLQGLARSGGQGTAWNGDTAALIDLMAPKLEAMIDAQIEARVGFLAGPVDGAANAGMRDAAGQLIDHLRIS